MAVLRAIQSGRLKSSVVTGANGKRAISNAALADQEWAGNTDLTKAPHYVQEREAARELPADGSPGESVASAAARVKHWDAKLRELKFKEAAGELVLARDVTRKVTEKFHHCKARLLALPSRARQDLPHLTLTDVAKLEEIVREALESLVEVDK